uniref:Uncharacterized protein n=1 Tax=Pararge aegeria TaxID=116150 RepID=S4PHG1_9NEOP
MFWVSCGYLLTSWKLTGSDANIKLTTITETVQLFYGVAYTHILCYRPSEHHYSSYRLRQLDLRSITMFFF